MLKRPEIEFEHIHKYLDDIYDEDVVEQVVINIKYEGYIVKANKEADNKRKEEAEIKNEADALIFQTEKAIKDLGDKVDKKDKEEAEDKIKELKEAIEKNDIDEIKKAKEALNEKAMALATKAYEEASKKQQAEAETNRMLDTYKEFFEKYLAIPVVSGRKTEKEKFAGAEYTLTIEALMQNGVSLQSATSHYFGQKFAKAYDIKFINNIIQSCSL